MSDRIRQPRFSDFKPIQKELEKLKEENKTLRAIVQGGLQDISIMRRDVINWMPYGEAKKRIIEFIDLSAKRLSDAIKEAP